MRGNTAEIKNRGAIKLTYRKIDVNTAEKLLVLLVIMVSHSFLMAQTSNFTTLGNWSSSLNWTAGIPNSTTNANISALSCDVDIAAVCLDLTISTGSFTISNTNSLTINGDFSITSFSSFVNKGNFTLNGDYYYDGVRKIEMGGSVTMNSGANIQVNTPFSNGGFD